MTARRSVFFAFQVHPSMLGLPPFTFDLCPYHLHRKHLRRQRGCISSPRRHLITYRTSCLTTSTGNQQNNTLTHSLACFLETSSRRWNLARLAVYPLPRCRAVDLLHNFCKITSAHSLLSVVWVCAVSSPYVFCGLCWDFSFILHRVLCLGMSNTERKKKHTDLKQFSHNNFFRRGC